MKWKREDGGAPKLWGPQDVGSGDWGDRSAHFGPNQPKVLLFPPKKESRKIVRSSKEKAVTQGLVILKDMAADFSPSLGSWGPTQSH